MAAAAAAGKVLWANEGFEKLAGVDAVDVVGEEICYLFEEGEGEEDEGGESEQHGELKRSLKLGKVGPAWSGLGQKIVSRPEETLPDRHTRPIRI